MVERDIEGTITAALSAALENAGVTGVRVTGAWDVADLGSVVGDEAAGDLGLLAVKVSPREYATATVPHATLACRAALTLRAESDARGEVRLAIADAVGQVLHLWQDDFAAFAAAFAGLSGARVCGFALGGGDVGLDRAAATWTFEQSFTINAIIERKET